MAAPSLTSHNSIRKPVSHCPPESAIHTPGLRRCHHRSLQEGHKPNPCPHLGVRLCPGIQKKRPGIVASRSSWCLLEWRSELTGWERHNRGSNRVNLCISVSHRLFLPLPPAVLLREGPFSLKSPRWLTSGWGCSVLGSFSFSIFLISASKKPLPPTPEDNRVSETFSAGREWAHCCGLLDWHTPTCTFPACSDFSDPLWRQQVVVLQLNSVHCVSWAWTVSWFCPCKQATELLKFHLTLSTQQTLTVLNCVSSHLNSWEYNSSSHLCKLAYLLYVHST